MIGCRKVSDGCKNCYAMKDAHRLAGNPNRKVADAYADLTMIQNGRVNWTGTFRELPDRLDQPLRWKKPRRIFVNSMSDLFGEGVSDEFIERVFSIMAIAPHHQFQVLTKRPDRMRAFLSSPRTFRTVLDAVPLQMEWRPGDLPNVWLGVSVEDQKAADERIPLLLQTPAAVRFLSCEPLLGRLDLSHWLTVWARVGKTHVEPCRGPQWVIVGGESGPGARPCNVQWIRAITDQCRASGVACFVKQLGSWPTDERLQGDRWLLQDKKGGDWSEWPEWLRVREFPQT